jgi:hypothetical protein
MRWIAGCLLAGVVALGGTTLLVKHFSSKPSDPNLAELGISSSVEELVAPSEPEATTEPRSSPLVAGQVHFSETIQAEVRSLSNPPIDQDVKPASFIDLSAAAQLDDSAYRWMPLCRDDETIQRDRASKGTLFSSELMPRCDDDARPLPLPPLRIKPR